MKKSFFIIIFIICTSSYSGWAKTQFINDVYARFENLTFSDGLASDRIIDIIQDSAGYIWIATDKGLNRFDGYSFNVYKFEKNDTLSIPDNFITSLEIDEDKRLWIGTKNGLCYYNSTDESFVRLNYFKHNKTLSNSYVRKVYYKNSILWVDCVDGILNKIDLTNNEIAYFQHDKIGYELYNYHTIFIDKHGLLWLGGRDMGPYSFDTSKNTFHYIKNGYDIIGKKRDRDIACIYQDSRSNYWMSATDGFYHYDKKNDFFTKKLAMSTFDIVESTEQNLWLACGGGLYYYDIENDTYTINRHNSNDKSSLIHDRINCLLIDKRGNLWIGTNGGISIRTKQFNAFRHYRHIPENKNSLAAEKVSCFIKDYKNQVWIGSMDNGIHLWDRKADQFISAAINPKLNLISKNVSCLYMDKKKKLWIGQWSGKGFSQLNLETLDVNNYSLLKNSTKRDWYAAFYEDNKDNLWVGFWGAFGVQFFNRDTKTFEPYHLNSFDTPGDFPIKQMKLIDDKLWIFSIPYSFHAFDVEQDYFTGFNKNSAHSIFPAWKKHIKLTYADLDNFLHCASILKINDFLFFPTEKGMYQYSNHHFTQVNTQNYQAACLSFDKKQIISIDENSITLFDPIVKSQKVLYQFIDSTSLLFDNKVNSIEPIDSTHVFIGSNNGLLCYNIANNTIDYKKDLPKCKLNNINLSSDGNIWIASDQGLFYLNENRHELKHWNIENSHSNGLNSEHIYCIKEHNKKLWLGSNKGLIEYNKQTQKFSSIAELNTIEITQIEYYNDTILLLGTQIGLIEFNPENKKITYKNKNGYHRLSSRLTSFIFEDKDGFIWIGTTNKGVNRLDTKDYHIQQYVDVPYGEKQFYGNNAACIYQLNNGELWIGANGINIYDSIKNTFNVWDENNGFYCNDVLGIIQDSLNQVWVITPKGIVLVNNNREIIKVFGSDYGIEPQKLNGAIYAIDEQTFLVGSNNGFYAFNPIQVSQNIKQSTFEITELSIFDKVVQSDFSNNQRIELNYNENFFTLLFSDFDFGNKTNRYIYQLKGVDKNWVQANENRASYTNLAPGKYQFILSSKNLNYSNKNNQKTIAISINPPFWRTWWFTLLLFLILASIIWMIYNQRIKEFKMREKSLELEQKLLRSEMNPHFVFNALIAIQSYIFKNQTQEAVRYLSKFAKLMRLFLQNTREAFIPLSQEVETLIYYVDMQKLRFNNRFDLNIHCDSEVETEFIAIPPMMIQPYIENAIEHGFLGIDYQGKIELSFKKLEEKVLEITIKDNGIGINQTKNSNNQNHQSLATTITNDRLAAFDKKGRFYLTIADRNDQDNTNGTTVTIVLPFIGV